MVDLGVRGLAVVLLATALLTGCSDDADPGPTAPSTTGAAAEASVAAPSTPTALPETDDPAYDAAVSEPVEDPVYPGVGDPGVDALHYGLDLSWTSRTRTLDAVETLTFRATRDAPRFQLDLGVALEARAARLDGKKVRFAHRGKDLVVEAPVTADERYVLELRYGGTPKPVAAPTTRSDFSTLGWTTTEEGEVWTMQEPFGAYSWYAVNDQPSDKALYDITVRAPSPWVGVANGALVSRESADGTTTTQWHLDEPAASYLVTVAIGDLATADGRSESGVPMSYWYPRGDRSVLRRLKVADRELDWLEDKLGPYPFSTLGFLVVDSRSGMETQTMITLGNGRYPLSPGVLVHEMAHQWYGDQVTPTDWRDLWMNEGMAQYLQGMWEAEHYQYDFQSTLNAWARLDQRLRDQAGPPADYDPATFGEGNVYYCTALMWDIVRRELGDREFWRLAAAWPAARDNGSSSYDDLVAWWSEESGRDLAPVFDDWLLSETTPAYP